MTDAMNESSFASKIFTESQVVRRLHAEKCGQAARADRLSKGKTLKEVADKMGCSITYVSALERGRKNWTWESAEKYYRALQETIKVQND